MSEKISTIKRRVRKLAEQRLKLTWPGIEAFLNLEPAINQEFYKLIGHLEAQDKQQESVIGESIMQP